MNDFKNTALQTAYKSYNTETSSIVPDKSEHTKNITISDWNDLVKYLNLNLEDVRRLYEVLKTIDSALANIGTGNILDSAVTSDKIAEGAVTKEKIGEKSVDYWRLADETVHSNHISPEAVDTSALRKNAVTTDKIKSGAVTSERIADGAVTVGKIADKSVSNYKLGDRVVTSDKLAYLAVDTEHISYGAVTENKIAEGAVTTERIADSAVRTKKIQDNAIITDKIADYAVTNAKIEDGAVTMGKLSQYVQTKLDKAYADVSYNAETGVLTFIGNDIFVTKEIDLPLELLLSKHGSHFDAYSKDIVLHLANGETIKIPLDYIVNSLEGSVAALRDGKFDKFADENGNYKNQIVTSQIEDGAVTNDKLSDDVRAELVTSVSASTADRYFTIKFAKGNPIKIPLSNFIPQRSIGSEELKASAVKTDNIAKEAITKAKLASDVISDLNTISKHERRIEQLEGLTLKTVTDSTEAYEKAVPVGVGKNAVINKVGGGLSSKNLCPVDVKSTYAMEDEKLYITLELGTYPAGRYYIRLFSELFGVFEKQIQFGDNLESFTEEYNFTLETDSEVLIECVSENAAYNEIAPPGFIYGTIDGVMICDASNGDLYNVPYEPYRGLTKPKSIESRGANLYNAELEQGGINNLGELTSITARLRTVDFIVLNAGTYTLSFPQAFNAIVRTYSVDEEYVSSESGFSYINSNILTFTISATRKIKFNFKKSADGAILPSEIGEIMLNVGSTALPYKPFSAEPIATFEIPEAIRNREGYGLSGSYIDFDRRVWVDADGKETDVSADLQYDDDFLFIEVEPGGSIKFVNEEGTEAPVPSTVTYQKKL